MEDFFGALARLRPSVSDEEMKHYERVQGEFRGVSMGTDGRVSMDIRGGS